MACLESNIKTNFLTWNKVSGSLTLSQLQSSGVPSLCDTLSPDTPLSPAPANLVATAISSSTISLFWDNVAGADSYKVYRSLTLGGTYTVIEGLDLDKDYDDTTCDPDTEYFYKVSAVIGGVESALTDAVSATTYDADAQAFIDASVITDTTQQDSINTLVVDLKAASLWSKMKAIYPFVGGTASTHKYNLKDPRDLDAAFRLSFSGGWTHASTGAKPNGTTGYADTHVVPATDMIENSTHIGVYIRDNIDETTTDIGVNNTSPDCRIMLSSRYSGTAYVDAYNFTTGRISVSETDSRGFNMGNRQSSSVHKYIKNGTQKGLTNTGASGTFSNITYSIYLAGGNYSGAGAGWSLSTREQAFASIGQGLSDAESLTYYNIIQEFQTTLGRQI